MEYIGHKKYLPMDHTFQKREPMVKYIITPIPIYKTLMNWFIKYHQSVEKVRKIAFEEGTTLGSKDEIVLGKNDLHVGEILYITIYL